MPGEWGTPAPELHTCTPEGEEESSGGYYAFADRDTEVNGTVTDILGRPVGRWSSSVFYYLARGGPVGTQ